MVSRSLFSPPLAPAVQCGSPAPIPVTFTWYHFLSFPLLWLLRFGALFSCSYSMACTCLYVFTIVFQFPPLFSLFSTVYIPLDFTFLVSVSRVGCSPVVSRSLFPPPLAPLIQCTVFLLLFLLHSHGIMSIFSPPLAPLVQCTVLLFL